MFGAISSIGNLTSVLSLGLGGPMGFVINQIAQRLLSSIVQNVIENLNLPQPFQNALSQTAQNLFGEPLGGSSDFHGLIDGLADAFGANLFQRGAMHQQAQDVHDSISSMASFMLQQMEENKEADTSERASRNNGGEKGWIRAMAEAMGEKLDEAWHEAESLADNIEKDDPSTSAEYQGAVQEFNFLMNSFSTAIKAAGEGSKAMASRQ